MLLNCNLTVLQTYDIIKKNEKEYEKWEEKKIQKIR